MQIDDSAEDDDGSQQVHDVGQILAIEGLTECKLLVRPGDEKMHKCNDRALELRSAASVDSRRRKGTPNDRLADVCSNEQADPAAQSIPLLQQLVQQNHNNRGGQELDDQQYANTCAEITGKAIETSEDEDAGIAKGEDDGEEFLGGLVEFAVGFEVEVDVDEVCAGE